MSHYQLFRDNQLEIADDQRLIINLTHDPIANYNYFIDQYNNKVNMVNNKILRKIPHTKLYSLTFKILNLVPGQISVSILLTISPILNVLIFLMLIYFQYSFKRGLEIFYSNKKNVENPFQNMIYSPEICSQLKKDHWYLKLQLENLEESQFNENCFKNLKLNYQNGQAHFMIYNSKFWSLQDYTKYENFHKIWMIWGVVLFGISLIIIKFFWLTFI